MLTYGNFTGADPDSSETKATFGINGGGLAIGFTVNRPNYTLSSFTIDLSRGGNATARLRLYRGSPGGELLSFSNASPSPGSNPALVTFTGSRALISGETYWLVIDQNGGNAQSSMSVHSAGGNNLPSGTANLSMVGYRVYTDEALTTHTGTQTADFPNFAITVPEPHEYALAAAISLSLFAAYRRRRLTA